MSTPEVKLLFLVFQSVTSVYQGRMSESWRYQLSNMACLQSVKRGTKAHVSSYYGLQTVCTIAPFPFNLVIVKKKQWPCRSPYKRYKISAFLYRRPTTVTELGSSSQQRKKKWVTLKKKYCDLVPLPITLVKICLEKRKKTLAIESLIYF